MLDVSSVQNVRRELVEIKRAWIEAGQREELGRDRREYAMLQGSISHRRAAAPTWPAKVTYPRPENAPRLDRQLVEFETDGEAREEGFVERLDVVGGENQDCVEWVTT